MNIPTRRSEMPRRMDMMPRFDQQVNQDPKPIDRGLLMLAVKPGWCVRLRNGYTGTYLGRIRGCGLAPPESLKSWPARVEVGVGGRMHVASFSECGFYYCSTKPDARDVVAVLGPPAPELRELSPPLAPHAAP